MIFIFYFQVRTIEKNRSEHIQIRRNSRRAARLTHTTSPPQPRNPPTYHPTLLGQPGDNEGRRLACWALTAGCRTFPDGFRTDQPWTKYTNKTLWKVEQWSRFSLVSKLQRLIYRTWTCSMLFCDSYPWRDSNFAMYFNSNVSMVSTPSAVHFSAATWSLLSTGDEKSGKLENTFLTNHLD